MTPVKKGCRGGGVKTNWNNSTSNASQVSSPGGGGSKLKGLMVVTLSVLYGMPYT
jgi:hypothetical protein